MKNSIRQHNFKHAIVATFWELLNQRTLPVQSEPKLIKRTTPAGTKNGLFTFKKQTNILIIRGFT